MRAIFRRTFLHPVAVLYTGGAVAQLLNLVFDFGFENSPFVVDWLIIVLGGYGGAGLVFFAGEFRYRGRWEKPLHWIIVFHLAGSVLLHLWTVLAGTHSIYALFPHAYSYFALAYFGLFAWRSWTTGLSPETAD